MSEYPWGPWTRVANYGIWGRIGWQMVAANKLTSSDGKKMWFVFSGEYRGDLYNYGFQYMPLYFSTGTVDRCEAENAMLVGPGVAASYPSFSGSGYIGDFAATGDRAIFSLDNVNGRGWHIIRIRYTCPLVNGNILSIYVNSRKVKRVRFSENNNDYQSFYNWADRSDIYYLEKGANTFEIRRDAGDTASGLLIDCIDVSREETYYEGKNVALLASATASSGQAIRGADGCSGDSTREWSANGTVGEWIKLD